MKKWMSEDSRVIEIVGGSDIILTSVGILRMKTREEGKEEEKEEEEEGGGGRKDWVSVSEKNGILEIVLDVVEGGGWKGKYEELEEVVNRLEEEGKKKWMEGRREKGKNGGREWKEMGRLAHDVGWAIEERKMVSEEGRKGDGEMISLRGMKKEAEEKDKQIEEEKKGREEEKRMKEEEKKRADRLEAELRELKERQKEEEDRRSALVTSLQSLPYYATKDDSVTRNGNTLSGSKSGCQSSIIGPELKYVCYCTSHNLNHFILL